jgi:mannosyltransferase
MKNNLVNLLNKLRQSKRIDIIAIAAALILYAGVTLHKMGTWSIWFDEAFSAYLTRFNYFQIARYTATDVHPPLYYWFLKTWVSIFGTTTEFDYRSLSMVFAMVAIVFSFLLVRRLFGRKAAWLSLLLLALSPMLVRYGQEARMYTMVAAIVLAATYYLVLATETNKRKYWIVYGILVSAGMWTHYFAAFAWLAHWAWRLWSLRADGLRGKELKKAFFSKNWKFAYKIAIFSFIPWIPVMLIQLTAIQYEGFWIAPVGGDTFTSYLTNLLTYLDHDQLTGIVVAAFFIICATLTVFGFKLYRDLDKKARKDYALILSLAFVPVILLFIASLPPFRSSFVERYLMPSIMAFSIFAAVTIVVGMKKVKWPWKAGFVLIIVLTMIYGISNVYYYGNYNKNSNTDIKTKSLVKEIDQIAPNGVPIIADSPWIFYEAIFYDTPQHPVYFIAASSYTFGSLDMLKDSPFHKITNITQFAKEHPKIWYIGNSGVTSPVAGWKEIDSFSIHSYITNSDPYQAAEYAT